MASTYSPALRLELMATGDQSGTWGDTTNTNLGTLLEQAITGYLSVAQGDVANLTLTTTDGASDQARNAVVEITGALTATRNVVVQTAEKLYTIKNSTTGGFSIVAKTTAGTGISIPPGASVNVYSDGTNVVMGQNYWNGQIGGAVYLDAGATVGPAMDLFRDSTSPAASDVMGQVVFNGRDSAANKQEYASIEATILDTTSTSEDGTLDLYATVAGTRTKLMSVFGTGVGIADGTVSLPGLSFISDPNTGMYRIGADNIGWAVNGAVELNLDGTRLAPGASDGSALGSTSLMWSDLFLASGGVINWNNGDVTITHSADTLTFSGASTAYVFNSSTSAVNIAPGIPVSISGTSTTNYGSLNISATSGSKVYASFSEAGVADRGAIGYDAASSTFKIRATNATGTAVLSVDSAGLIITLGQIQFPATQNPSSDANTLDDYEEGTATPAIGGTATYTTQQFVYNKIGNAVIVSILRLTINLIGTGSASSVSGLPFTSNSTNGTSISIGYFGAINSSVTSLTGYVDANATTMTMTGLTAAAASITINISTFKDSGDILAAFSFRASA